MELAIAQIMLLLCERSSPSVFFRVKVSSAEMTAQTSGVRRASSLFRFRSISRARAIFWLGGRAADRVGIVAYLRILLVRRQDGILLIRFNQRRAVQYALNEHRDALLGKGLRVGCADTPADLTAKGQADALTDLIGFQLAAADAGVKGIALRAGGFRGRNARPPVPPQTGG